MGIIRTPLFQLRRSGRFAIAPLLVASLAATPPTPAKERVGSPAEILAIQALVAQVAAPRPPADIADFQRGLAGEDRAPVKADSDHTATPGNALSPVSLRVAFAAFRPPVPVAFAVPRPQRLTPGNPFVNAAIAPRSKVERFRLNLTPHAPPDTLERTQLS